MTHTTEDHIHDPDPPIGSRGWWNDQRVARLRELRSQGHSLRAMAVALETTRNAIVGKLNRLKLTVPQVPLTAEQREARLALRRERDVEKKRRKRAKNKPEGRTEIRFVRANSNSSVLRLLTTVTCDIGELREADIIPHNVALVDLTEHCCRYPYGNGPIAFCGHTKLPGSSYCPAHTALCCRPIEARGVAA